MSASEKLRRVHKRAAVMRQIHEDLNADLNAIATRFKIDVKLTLVVRHPNLPGDTSIVMTNDDLDEVIAEIQKRKADDTHVF